MEIRFHFRPDTAFGNRDSGGRTWRQSTPGGIRFNANTGHFIIDPAHTLEALDVLVQSQNMDFVLKGNILTISTQCDSNQGLTELIESMYYAFPFILSFQLRDPVMMDRVEGRVGTVNFAWELSSWQLPILITNTELQEGRVIRAWELLDFISRYENRRVIAALSYFYKACRLRRTGHTPWEFMNEILLNLCKVLEVLFPPSGNGYSRNSARNGLKELGYSEKDIEANFIPVMALRSKIDVSHVFLGLFNRPELTILYCYLETIEAKWQEMLDRLLVKLENEQITLQPHEVTSADQEAKEIIEKLKANIDGKM